MELVQVASDVYACLQDGAKLGESNSGFVRRDGGLVIDSFWDLPRTRKLIELYSSVSAEPASRLVNTHHNGDHCWGNQLFAETGAEIIGHRLCVESFFKEGSPEGFQMLLDMDDPPPGMAGFLNALRVFDFHGITLTPPTTIIDGDTTLTIGDTSAELLYLGPAHTAGDTAVWMPDDGVVFTGDVLFQQCTPVGWEGTYATWIASLERLAALEPAVVVPGHGPVTDVSGLLAMKSYLEYVLREARAQYDAGLSTLDAAKKIDLAPFSGWAEPERLAFQIDRAYREFDGVAWDTPVDAMKVFAEMGALREWYEAGGSAGAPQD